MTSQNREFLEQMSEQGKQQSFFFPHICVVKLETKDTLQTRYCEKFAERII